MLTNKTYRYRIYPNAEQRIWMSRQIGSCRFVYNHFLRARIDHYAAHRDDPTGPFGKGLTFAQNNKALTQLKKQPETSFLEEVGSQALQGALVDLDSAYNNFFRGLTKFPQFHKKGNGGSYSVPQNFDLNKELGTVRLPKIGKVKAVFHRPIPENSRIKNLRVTKLPSGEHYISVCVEEDLPSPSKLPEREIGVDLGLKDFITTSTIDGEIEKVPAPKFLRKKELRLKRLQRRLSRRIKGSNGRAKARLQVSKQHQKVSNQRKDFLHKLSNRLTRENQAISVESLSVRNMSRNHSLAKSILDAGWGEFLRQLQYKGSWRGCQIKKVDRFFPSSKRCSKCGWINESLKLKDRSWTCRSCGVSHDRDSNAAMNILIFGTAGTAGTVSSEETQRRRTRVESHQDSLKPEIRDLSSSPEMARKKDE